MVRRLLAAALACAAVLASTPLVAVAQSDSGSIRILVIGDPTAKTPVALARVVLDGPVIASEVTRANGEVLFTDVPDGIYRARVAKSGYTGVTSVPFEIVNGNSVLVTVTLATATSMKTIATVTARSTAVVTTESVSQDSAQRKLSSDLADALNKISGVSVSTTGDDNDATQTISLEGHDASQTQLSLDGVPLNAPGTAGNLGMFATDLFGGASVNRGPQIGGLGGGVNFSTLQPTLTWRSQAQLGVGSNGKDNALFGESGSLDKFGFAFEGSVRQNTSLIDGLRYLDASGLDYVHDGDSTIYGDLARLRYQFSGAQTVTATFLGSQRQTDLACLRITQTLPCGYGPGNRSDGNVQLYSLSDNALIGETDVVASVYSSTFSMLNDQLNRYVDGIAQPIGFSTTNQSRGFTLSATLPERERHTFSVQLQTSASSQLTTPLVSSATPYYNGTANSYYDALTLTDTVHSNDKLTLNESFGASSATGNQRSALGSLGATWKPDAHDAFAASVSFGGVAAGFTRDSVLTDPASLRFDCNGNVVYGNAPGDSPSGSSSTSERLSYTRSLRNDYVSVQLYNQVQRGTVLPVQVNGTVLAANGTLSPAYLAAVQAVYQSPAGCGTSAPLAASQLYFTSPVGGVTRVYQGGSISGFVHFGDLVVQPFWDTTVSKILSNDPRIDNPYSITQSGQQVPNVPLQRAGVVMDYKAPRSAVEWLADAQYTGKNNPNNLPAYTQFDAAVSTTFQHGTLTFAANNISNVLAGTFASPTNAVPYVTQNGTVIPTIARPLAPRNYTVTYSVRFGQGGEGSTTGGLRAAQGTPGAGGPQGGGDRGGGFFRQLQGIPATPPANPLDLQPSCSGDAAATAKTFSSEIKAYVAQIERAKTPAGYPATMSPPDVEGATVTYHGLGSTYALTIVPKLPASGAPVQLASQVLANQQRGGTGGASGGRGNGGALRAFVTCFALHIAQPDDVTSHHLYSAGSERGGLFRAPQLLFMPSVGLYFEARPPQAGQETFRVYALPSAPPANPFDVRTAASCTDETRSTASDALAELRAYFANPATAKTPLWTITAHAATSGTWYDLAPNDPAMLGALISCGRVATATPQDIVGKGWDGAMPPHLNYAQPFGIYLIRPQPNPSPASGR